MHWLKLRMPLSSCRTSVWFGALPPFGSRCWQAFWAVWYREVLTPRSCALGNFAVTWPGRGSGKLGTPFERMQREKATSWEFSDPAACDAPPELVDDGPELHAASRAVTATAVQEHSVRARLRRSVWRTGFTRGHLSRVLESRITASRLAAGRPHVVSPRAGNRPHTHRSLKSAAVRLITPGGDSPWCDDRPGGAAYREVVHLKLGGAALARTRSAVVAAWQPLAQAAAGADPVPAWRWRSRWQRRAAVWGLAAATAAAVTGSVVYVMLSAAGTKTFGLADKAGGKVAPPQDPKAQILNGLGQNSAHHAQGGLIGFLNLPTNWALVLLIIVSLVGVAPLPLAVRRPLLGWRIGWLALAVMPWMGIESQQKPGTIAADWPWNPVQAAVLVAVFAVAGVRHSRGVLWWMWALTLLPWWLQAARTDPGLTVLAVGTVVFTAVALGAKAFGGSYRERLEMAEAAERAEAEAGRRAVLEERARIAREMHDVVAHHLSLIAVRAEAAPYRLERLASDTRAEFGELGETAREALAEMRRLLGVLRTGEAAEQGPQPGLGDLPGLVAAARGAGLAVELSQRGPLDGLPVAVGMCAYRIVQESLSNAGRHAPGAAISVTADVERAAVLLKICNGPPTGAPNGDGARTPLVSDRRHGHGLAGMRERVTLLGGTFSAGSAPGGGFEVAAELPTGERL
jgi:signal transduction histidine kinase